MAVTSIRQPSTFLDKSLPSTFSKQCAISLCKTYKERQDSFKTYPRLFNSRTNPSDLAEAGFHYNGHEIKCIVCGLVFDVNRVQKGESPVRFHKRLSSNCGFNREFTGECSSSDDDDDDSICADGDSPDGSLSGQLEPDTIETYQPPRSFRSTTGITKDKRSLERENERLRLDCRRCRKERIQILFLPCRHLVTCERCAEIIDDCLICGETILGTVKTYFG
jgi:ribosomal protein S27E